MAEDINSLEKWLIPDTWSFAKLEDFGSGENAIVDGPFGSNLKVSDYIDDQANGVPVLTTKNLEGDYSPKSVRYISKQKYEELKRSSVKPGDILVAKIGSVGKTGIYPRNAPVAIIPANLLKFTVGSHIVFNYLYIYLKSHLFQNFIKAISTATAQPAFNVTKFRKLPIPVPPLAEQHRIVAKIEELFSELDEGVKCLEMAREQLRVYRQAVLKHAFEGKLTERWRAANQDKLESPEQLLARIQAERDARYQQQFAEWEAAVQAWKANGKQGKKPRKPSTLPPLLEVSDELRANLLFLPSEWFYLSLESLAAEAVLGKMLDKQKNKGEKRKYLGNINVRWGTFDFDKLKFMRIEEDEIQRYSLKKGDLVICEGGEPGRCAVWEGENDVMFIQKALHRVRFTESYDPYFAHYYILFAITNGFLERNFTGTTIKHLTGKGLGQVPLPICSLSEQLEIVRNLETTLSRIEALEAEIDDNLTRAAALRQSILQKAFSGQLVPQEPGDEPAAALLQRIQAEKSRG